MWATEGQTLGQPGRGRDRRRTPHRNRPPAVSRGRRARSVTVVGGMSFALMIPKERIVRSSGTPPSSTATASEHTQPRAMWHAPVTYERRTGSSRGSPAMTATETSDGQPDSSTTTSARARPPSGPDHRRPSRPRRSGRAFAKLVRRRGQNGGLGPARRPDSRRHGRADNRHLLYPQQRCRRLDGPGHTQSSGDPDHAGSVGPRRRPRWADAWGRDARRPPGRASPVPVSGSGRPVRGPRPERSSAPLRRRLPHWRPGWPAARREHTTTRRFRDMPALPRWSAAPGPNRLAEPLSGRSAISHSGGPGPSPQPPWPRSGSRRRPNPRPRPERRPGSPPGPNRRRNPRGRR